MQEWSEAAFFHRLTSRFGRFRKGTVNQQTAWHTFYFLWFKVATQIAFGFRIKRKYILQSRLEETDLTI